MVLVTSQSLGLFGACGSCSQRPKAAFAESDIDCCIYEAEATAVWCCGSNLFLYRSGMNKTHNAPKQCGSCEEPQLENVDIFGVF